MAANHDAGIIDATEHRRQLRRAVLAATIGTAIEWYDFFLYSTVTGLVFARLYFPRSDPFVGTLEAFGVYAVGFLARPIGAALLLMGSATFLVAMNMSGFGARSY
jgi:hypothetical protein